MTQTDIHLRGRYSSIMLFYAQNDLNAAASLTINEVDGVANNNGIVITADDEGDEGNSITIELVDPGANDVTLSVDVTDSAITVTLGTDGGGAIATTATDLIDLLNGDTDAAALIGATNYSTSDGSGLMADLAVTNLTGGNTRTAILKVSGIFDHLQKDSTHFEGTFPKFRTVKTASDTLSVGDIGVHGNNEYTITDIDLDSSQDWSIITFASNVIEVTDLSNLSL